MNPFLSQTFINIWCLHFNDAKDGTGFDFITLLFKKSRYLPIYSNLGSTNTKGITYELNEDEFFKINSEICLIYDVPEYLQSQPEPKHEKLGLYRVKQYPGYFIDLKQFNGLNDYLQKTFSKSSRYKLNKYKKRFESCFDVHYKVFTKDINDDEFNFVFQEFRNLLKKRFDTKGLTNNNLNPKEWAFYKAVTLPMVREGKAALFVIYDGERPVGVTLNFLSEKMVFDAITVFDIAYSKFHLGSITIIKLVEWAMREKFAIFDFSKGYFDYKERWATNSYSFFYDIYYNKHNPISKSIAFALKNFFIGKNMLRNLNVNTAINSFLFRLKKNDNIDKTESEFQFYEPSTTVDLSNEYHLITSVWGCTCQKAVFEFQYLNAEHTKDILIYENKNKANEYYIKGKSKDAFFRITT
ncbi:MAG: GNAT family N-acetyltransferase [Maribacter sp.]